MAFAEAAPGRPPAPFGFRPPPRPTPNHPARAIGMRAPLDRTLRAWTHPWYSALWAPPVTPLDCAAWRSTATHAARGSRLSRACRQLSAGGRVLGGPSREGARQSVRPRGRRSHGQSSTPACRSRVPLGSRRRRRRRATRGLASSARPTAACRAASAAACQAGATRPSPPTFPKSDAPTPRRAASRRPARSASSESARRATRTCTRPAPPPRQTRRRSARRRRPAPRGKRPPPCAIGPPAAAAVYSRRAASAPATRCSPLRWRRRPLAPLLLRS
mmetsp:Transcript_66524/g.198736  ORF Transcript_66524/g.198736 Transcript_66524/m.198736 type:complete len:274 (+) Transcript_66524:184-1005(+)